MKLLNLRKNILWKMKGRKKILESNKLIRTDTLWYRINNFFRNLFSFKKKSINSEIQDEKVIINNKTVKINIDESNFRKILAENLVNGDIVIGDLTDKEVEEMIEFFTKSIEEIDEELVKRKDNILRIKNRTNEISN